MSEFNTVGILSRPGADARIADTLRRLYAYFIDRGIAVVTEASVAGMLQPEQVKVVPYDELGRHCDLGVVVGGDGSMLAAARALVKHDVPLLGINRGVLGFLTDISAGELETKLDEILAGRFSTERRFLLEAKLQQADKVHGAGQALNDVVLSSGQSARMIEFELFIDDRFVYSQRSNGLIVSTPTGSTAYALSGGGPILHPSLGAIVLVPMFPHTMTARPIVVNGDSSIRIVCGALHDAAPLISCDGHVHFAVSQSDEVCIQKMEQQLRLIHPLAYDFYEGCRNKLGWGSRLGERSENL